MMILAGLALGILLYAATYAVTRTAGHAGTNAAAHAGAYSATGGSSRRTGTEES